MNEKILLYFKAPRGLALEIAQGKLLADFLPHPAELTRKKPRPEKEPPLAMP